MRPIIPLLPLALIVAACGGPAETTPVATSDFDVKLPPVVTEAEWPWGLAFLPNGDLLFTEKEGGLKFVAGGEGTPSSVTGLPEAFIEGQAGYLGLVLDPDFETNRMVYISYSKGDVLNFSIVLTRLNILSEPVFVHIHLAILILVTLFKIDIKIAICKATKALHRVSIYGLNALFEFVLFYDHGGD